MITAKENERLREILGKKYVPELKKVLKENDVRIYSDGYLRQIFCGNTEKLAVESCIWKLASIEKQSQLERQKELNPIKNNVLNQ